MNAEQARKSITDYISEREYTYTVDGLIPEYIKAKTGCYISFSAKDVIKHCSKSFQLIALSALCAQQERENPKPLTLDELKERVGKPVWLSNAKKWVFISTIQDEPYAQIWFFTSSGFANTVLYYHEKFYDHEPKEAQKG